MPRQHIRTSARSAAPPEAVYALLADPASWSVWGMWDSSTVESTAPDGSDGVGSVRRLTSRSLGRRVVSREEVVELVPGRRYGYALLSGLPLEGYRGLVELEPDGAGTAITWSSSFDARVPGTGWLYALALRPVLAKAAAGVARFAATSSAAA
jgi:hypothetical protein